jgi:hypothetical protein
MLPDWSDALVRPGGIECVDSESAPEARSAHEDGRINKIAGPDWPGDLDDDDNNKGVG